MCFDIRLFILRTSRRRTFRTYYSHKQTYSGSTFAFFGTVRLCSEKNFGWTFWNLQVMKLVFGELKGPSFDLITFFLFLFLPVSEKARWIDFGKKKKNWNFRCTIKVTWCLLFLSTKVFVWQFENFFENRGGLQEDPTLTTRTTYSRKCSFNRFW